MSDTKQLPTGGTIPMGKAGRAIKTKEVVTEYLITEILPLSSNWPDVDALADLITAEVEEQQATTPEAWVMARLKWFDAHARYFGYGRSTDGRS